MRAEQIKAKAARIKKEYQTEDLFEICGEMGIWVHKNPMGTQEGSCKGFFTTYLRQKIITLNSDISEENQRIILAHELGHAMLHAQAGVSTFHDFALLNSCDIHEYEANIFASEFLIDDNMVLEAIEEGRDFYTVASELCVPPEMLDFKLRLLQKQGHPIVAPYIAKSDFLKRDIEKALS